MLVYNQRSDFLETFYCSMLCYSYNPGWVRYPCFYMSPMWSKGQVLITKVSYECSWVETCLYPKRVSQSVLLLWNNRQWLLVVITCQLCNTDSIAFDLAKYSQLPLSIKHQIQLANLYFCELVPYLKFKRSTIIWLCIESYNGIIVMYIILYYEYSNMHQFNIAVVKRLFTYSEYTNGISVAASAHSYKPWYCFTL